MLGGGFFGELVDEEIERSHSADASIEYFCEEAAIEVVEFGVAEGAIEGHVGEGSVVYVAEGDKCELAGIFHLDIKF